MSKLPGIRWFNPQKQVKAMAAMNDQCLELASQISSGPSARPDKYALWMGLACGGLVLLLMGGLAGLLMLSPRKAEPNYPMVIALFTLLPAAAGVAGYLFFKRLEAAQLERFEAFSRIKEVAPGLTPLFGKPIGPYSIPVVFCVDNRPAQFAWATGSHQGQPLHWLTISHTYDPQGPNGSMINRHQRITSRSADAIVLQTRLRHLPEMFIGPKSDVFFSYLDLAIGQSTPISGLASSERYAGTSDESRAKQAISPGLKQLISENPDLFIQVVGGFVVLHGMSFGLTPANMVTKLSEIKSRLDLAVDVFHELEGTKGQRSPRPSN